MARKKRRRLDYRALVLQRVKMDGRFLQYFSEDLQNDREIVLEAVKNHWRALEYASEDLQNDRDIVLEAVKTDCFVYLYA